MNKSELFQNKKHYLDNTNNLSNSHYFLPQQIPKNNLSNNNTENVKLPHIGYYLRNSSQTNFDAEQSARLNTNTSFSIPKIRKTK